MKQPQLHTDALICRCTDQPLHLPLMSARFQIRSTHQLVSQHFVLQQEAALQQPAFPQTVAQSMIQVVLGRGLSQQSKQAFDSQKCLWKPSKEYVSAIIGVLKISAEKPILKFFSIICYVTLSIRSIHGRVAGEHLCAPQHSRAG